MKKTIVAVMMIWGVFGAHSRLHAQSTTYTPGPVPPVAGSAAATSTTPKPVARKMVQLPSDSAHTSKTASGVKSASGSSAATPARKLPPLKAHMIAPDTAATKKPGGGH
jgi:hypothetical protein